MQNIINLNLDLKNKNYSYITAQQNDDIVIKTELYDNGLPVNLNNAVIIFNYVSSNSSFITISEDNITKSGNIANINCKKLLSGSVGEGTGQITIVSDGKQSSTFPLKVKINKGIIKNQISCSNAATILESISNSTELAVKSVQNIKEAEKIYPSTSNLYKQVYLNKNNIFNTNNEVNNKANKEDVYYRNIIDGFLSKKLGKDDIISFSQIQNALKGKIDQTFLTDGLISQIAGTASIHATVADKSITYAKIADKTLYRFLFEDYALKIYPFSYDALNYNSGGVYAKISKGIKDIKLFGASKELDYYIRTFQFNYDVSGSKRTYIDIYDSNNSIVCSCTTLESISGTNVELKLETSDTRNIFGLIVIDCSYFNDGDNVLGTLDKNKISKQCIVNIPDGFINNKMLNTDTKLYPFCSNATCYKGTPSMKKIFRSIKDVKVFGGDRYRKLYIKSFMYKYDFGGDIGKRTYISVWDDYKNEKVAETYYKHNIDSSTDEEEKIILHEFNNSGIEIYIYVNFNEYSEGEISDTGTYLITCLSSKCNIEDDDKVEILVPDKIYATVGIETNIYWEDVIMCTNINNYSIKVKGNGLDVGNRWSYIPVEESEFNIEIKVFKNMSRCIASKIITVISKNNNIGASKTIKSIHIGDSLTDNEFHIKNLKNNLKETGINYLTLGTRSDGTNNHEGRGGWTSNMYLKINQDEKTGIVNPFYNPVSKTFDFSYYINNQGYSGLNYVFIMLGTNDIKSTTELSGLEGGIVTYVNNINKIINSIHEYDLNIKVCICMPILGAKDQYAYSNLYKDNRINKELHKAGIQLLNSSILNEFDKREYQNIFVIPTLCSLDTENAMQTQTIKIASRINKDITVQCDPYHPTEEGYMQIADSEFCFLMCNEQQNQ